VNDWWLLLVVGVFALGTLTGLGVGYVWWCSVPAERPNHWATWTAPRCTREPRAAVIVARPCAPYGVVPLRGYWDWAKDGD
jgi:hypothetical protein